jgi:ABC-type sugar transport system permease subunit
MSRTIETNSRIAPYLFIAPMMIGLLVFRLGPSIVAVFASFTRWNVRTSPEWVGLANYREMFQSDLFWKVAGNSVIFSAIFVPGVMIGALILAVLLNRSLPGIAFFRAMYFLPWITTMVAAAFSWRWILATRFGILNSFLRDTVGISSPPAWLSDSNWALPTLAFVSIWEIMGFQMIIFLAGLQAIPPHLYEAARVDGASRLRQFWHVTLPGLAPITFFVFIITLIDSFRTFEVTFALTGGGPNNETETLAFSIYKNAFNFGRMGYASAQAVVLVVAVGLLGWLSFWWQRRMTGAEG